MARLKELWGFLINTKKHAIKKYYARIVRSSLKLELIVCPICGNKDSFRLVKDHDRYGLPMLTKECTDCGLWMEQPAPTEEFLHEFYTSKMYRGLYLGVLRATETENDGALIKAGRHMEFIEKMPDVKSVKSLLDFGSAFGSFLLEFRKRNPGVKIYGLEPGVNFRKLNESRLDQMFGNIAEIPDNLEFDLITLWHVLEHLKDPVATLAELGKHLSPNGKIVIEVPDRTKYTNIKSFHIAHLYHFNTNTLKLLAEKTDLSLESISHAHLIDPTGVKAVFARKS